MSTPFKSGTTDFAALCKRREDLFGPRPGTENGVDTTRRPDPPKFGPGHYLLGYDELSGLIATTIVAIDCQGETWTYLMADGSTITVPMPSIIIGDSEPQTTE